MKYKPIVERHIEHKDDGYNTISSEGQDCSYCPFRDSGIGVDCHIVFQKEFGVDGHGKCAIEVVDENGSNM